MAKRTEGFDEAILKHAKIEFLENGYELASLRTIAQNASVSTSTIYTRFGDKEGLFKALVSPAADKLLKYMHLYFFEFENLDANSQIEGRGTYSDQGYNGFLDILYNYFDEFKLLVNSSTNGIYRSYLDQIVDMDVHCTVEFLKISNNSAYQSGLITEGFIHILSAGFYSGLFEIVAQNMERKDSERYFQELKEFYSRGWSSYLN